MCLVLVALHNALAVVGALRSGSALGGLASGEGAHSNNYCEESKFHIGAYLLRLLLILARRKP